jgi:hypothetical protein
MTSTQDDSESAEGSSKRVAVPILVGIAGKRRSRLEALGVSEAEVRTKLHRAFALLETLTPNSPKLLLCGMADGVDEIAAKLVIAANSDEAGQRKFQNWSVVGLLPLPEAAFVDDFPADEGCRWWYYDLDPIARQFVRLMPLEPLSKRAITAADGAIAEASYTADELRRHPDQPNPVRTAHYEQLGLVLAERSTVLIAVMPEAEVPTLLGGTAQVVAHRLNGWRSDWPPSDAASVAAASREFVVPPDLAASGSNDVWLVPIGATDGKPDVDLRLLRGRREIQPRWPQPLDDAGPGDESLVKRVLERVKELWSGRFAAADRDVLIRDGRPFLRRASSSSHVFRIVETFNRRAAMVEVSKPPSSDRSIAANPADPCQWSPIAAADRLRRTLSDVQVVHKRRVRLTILALGSLAWFSILILELYLELHGTSRVLPLVDPFWQRVYAFLHKLYPFLPLVYVVIVGAMIVLLWIARRRLWAAVAEDYRMVAEALRVQIAWWHFGLIRRHERVDQRALRYDTGEFQLLRQSLATVLDAIGFSHAALSAVQPGECLPPHVEDWIGVAGPPSSGQIRYQFTTAEHRKWIYNRFEFFVWSFFGVALGLTVLLALDAWHDAANLQYLDWLSDKLHGTALEWLIPLCLFVGSLVWLGIVVREHFEGKAERVTLKSALHGFGPGIVVGLAIIAVWHFGRWEHPVLHQLLGTVALLLLALAGAIKFVSEKLGVEAEAQGAVEASIIYSRARRSLDQIDRDVVAKLIDVAEATRRRERIVLDLGQYALTETESWLRSHRERPLHPPIGS